MLDIKRKILNRSKSQGKKLSKEDLPQLHHDFMKIYGWIPIEEFKEIPINIILSLYPKVQEDIKKSEEWRVYSIRLLAGFVGAKSLKDYK